VSQKVIIMNIKSLIQVPDAAYTPAIRLTCIPYLRIIMVTGPNMIVNVRPVNMPSPNNTSDEDRSIKK
jgi:hypothetical protein